MGRWAIVQLAAAARVSVLIVDTASWAVVAPFRGKGLRVRSTVEHFVEFGVRSLPIVGLICFLIGVIIGLQSSYTLDKWGANRFIAVLVAVSAKFLVVPKFLAMIIAVPCVTVIGMFIMIVGGFFAGVFIVHVDPGIYFEMTVNSLAEKDFAIGLIKSFFFGVTICWVGIYRGFQVEGGAEGVGRMTTSSVVTSIFLIIIVDLVFTVLFYFI